MLLVLVRVFGQSFEELLFRYIADTNFSVDEVLTSRKVFRLRICSRQLCKHSHVECETILTAAGELWLFAALTGWMNPWTGVLNRKITPSRVLPLFTTLLPWRGWVGSPFWSSHGWFHDERLSVLLYVCTTTIFCTSLYPKFLHYSLKLLAYL